MTPQRIEFSLVRGREQESNFPRPYPANKEIPDWFKSMPAENEADGGSVRTIKNCLPFLEAMACGYVIPVVADITLSLDHAGEFRGQSSYASIVQMHLPNQVPGAPFANRLIVKILNPWLIRTPPGYSTLFLPLLNRFELPLFPLAGLVETDIFYREVNFPAILRMAPGTSLALPRGTPLVQVIPIKRDEFQSEFVPPDIEKFNAMDLATRESPENYNFYKNNFWRKKSYR
jgi:hypothetical protein